MGEAPSVPDFAGGRENLIAWRSDVEAMNVDAALSVGDISDLFAGAEDAASLIADMDNHHALHGNHDLAVGGASDKSSQKDAVRALYGMPANYYAFDAGFVRVIMLDSCYDSTDMSEAASTGHLPDTQLTWLGNELSSIGVNYPTLIAIHHTTWPASSQSPVYFNAADVSALENLIVGRENTWVIAGHRHPPVATTDMLGGRPVFTVRPLCNGLWSLVTIIQPEDGPYCIDVTEQVIVLIDMLAQVQDNGTGNTIEAVEI